MTGRRKHAGVILAGTDRIAVDAVGVALLKELGSKKAIMDKRVFEQTQITRAAELGLGVGRPDQIRIVSDTNEGQQHASHLTRILLE